MRQRHLQRLKYLATINDDALPESTDPERAIRYLDISSVGRGHIVAEPEPLTFEAAPSRARRLVRSGDTIVSTVRTYLRAVLPIRDLEADLVVSTGFAVLRPRAEVVPRFLSWVIQSDTFIEEVVARSVGVSYPGINASEIGDIRIPAPALSHQTAIADYLDTETARIDALIAKQQQMADLLSERRRALITVAVTSEGEVAGEYGLSRRLKTLASLIVNQNDHGALPYIALEHVGAGTGSLVPTVELPIHLGSNTGASAVRTDDVLFGKLRPYLAKTLLIRDLAYASTEFLALRAGPELEPRYLAYLVGSQPFVEWATATSDGTKMPRTGWDKVGEFRVNALPTRATQVTIADDLDAETALIDAISAKKQRMLELLREYRRALITVAVTGGLEIPGVAA